MRKTGREHCVHAGKLAAFSADLGYLGFAGVRLEMQGQQAVLINSGLPSTPKGTSTRS